MSEDKKPIDWEAIERDYRADIKSLRQMADEYGCSHVAIKKRADKEGWTKDLSAKIKAKAVEKVNSEAVNSEVNAERKIAEKEVIEANAELQKSIILAHRKDIKRSREVAIALLAELESQTNDAELYEKLAELVNDPESSDADKMQQAFKKAIGLSSRVDTMKKLSETLKNLVVIEREAFGIGSGEDKPQTAVIIQASKIDEKL